MSEYNKILNHYSFKAYWVTSSLSEEEWENTGLAEKYLEKYWLSDSEYLQKWYPKQKLIFNDQANGLPDIMFQNNYKILVTRGGSLFIKEDFVQLQHCMNYIKDDYFVVIEDRSLDGELPPIKMKFPSTISWDKLLDRNFMASFLVEGLFSSYFVFGDSGEWGIYSDNEYIWPMHIIGVKCNHLSLFHNFFRELEQDFAEVKDDWLPNSYQYLIENIF